MKRQKIGHTENAGADGVVRSTSVRQKSRGPILNSSIARMTGQGQDRYALAERVSGAWVTFARSGNPNHNGLPKWNPFNAEQRPTRVFDNECDAVNDPHREERLAIKTVLDSRPNTRRG